MRSPLTVWLRRAASELAREDALVVFDEEEDLDAPVQVRRRGIASYRVLMTAGMDDEAEIGQSSRTRKEPIQPLLDRTFDRVGSALPQALAGSAPFAGARMTHDKDIYATVESLAEA